MLFGEAVSKDIVSRVWRLCGRQPDRGTLAAHRGDRSIYQEILEHRAEDRQIHGLRQSQPKSKCERKLDTI
jgi:hypothetical protein